MTIPPPSNRNCSMDALRLFAMLNIQFCLPGAWSILQAPLLMIICLALFFLLRKFIPWAMPYIAATK